MEFTPLVLTWKDKEEKSKAEFLGRLVGFKIAARVGLVLNTHKQDSQLMTKHNVLRQNDKLFITLLTKN